MVIAEFVSVKVSAFSHFGVVMVVCIFDMLVFCGFFRSKSFGVLVNVVVVFVCVVVVVMFVMVVVVVVIVSPMSDNGSKHKSAKDFDFVYHI